MNRIGMRAYPALGRLSVLLAAERRRRAGRAALRAAWAAFALHLAVLAALDWVSLRHPLASFWLAAMGFSFLIYLPVPAAFFLAFAAQSNSTARVARDLDRANPAAPDPFRTALSLSNHPPETLAQLDRILSPHLGKLRYPHPSLVPRSGLAALGAAALLFLAAALGSGRPREFLARAVSPWGRLGSLPVLAFDLDPGRRLLGEGDTARVTGGIRNLIPGQEIFAYVRTGGGETRYRVAPGADGRFSFSHGPADSDFTLVFAGANGRSRPLSFRVAPPPYLSGIRVVLRPPAYARLPPDTLAAGILRFPVLPGTRVEWNLRADRPLRRVIWNFHPAGPERTETPASPGEGAQAREDTLGPGMEFAVAGEIRAATDYSYRLEDGDGIRSRPTVAYRIETVPDLRPEVEMVAPASDTLLDRDGKLALAFRAKDDFGISSFRLVWKVMADGKARAQGKRDARDWLAGAVAGSGAAVWDLSGLRLREGEAVAFHFEAVDNDSVSGPKVGRSVERIARMPGLEEVASAVRKREQSAESSLKNALQLGKRLERKLERESETPREDGPPLLADYEVNRVMVDDPAEHRQRTEAALGRLRRALGAQEGAPGGEGGRQSAEAQAEVRKAARELEDFLRRSEAEMPRGNQAMLPAEERRKNLDRLMRSQKEQAGKLAALRAKLDRAPPRKPGPAQANRELAKAGLAELAKDLEKNRANQADLAKLFAEREAQEKSKSDLMDQAIQEQMKMVENMQAARQDLQKAAESEARNGLLSPELIEKMKQVQELLQEVLPDSLRRMMESKLQGQEVDRKELQERLKEMLDKQAEVAESLDRALAMLEQIKDRKRMEELRRTLGGLQSREEGLEKALRAGRAGADQDAEQEAIAREARKAMEDFSAQAEARKNLQAVDRSLKSLSAQQEMREVRQSLAQARAGDSKSAASAAARSASAAAAKLGKMGEMLGKSMQAMQGNAIDIAEASEILQESLALSRLQLLIRSGSARRRSEGWVGDEAVLYADVARTAAWLRDRVKAMSARAPFLGDGLNGLARGFAQSAEEASRSYSRETAGQALFFNQALSRELLKLLKMAQNGGGGGGSSGGGSESQGGGGQGGGDLASALKGMSGKQMAINQATYQLLKAMMEGRAPGPGSSGEEQGQSGRGANGEGEGQGENGQGPDGGLGGMANRQGELGETLESMAESEGEAGGAAQKLRSLAEEARRLEEDLRQGRIGAEEVKRRQDRFQSRLLEAANALQERGQSQERQAETSRGNQGPPPAEARAAEEARLLKLLREARREAKSLKLDENQRKRLEEYYETLLTR